MIGRRLAAGVAGAIVVASTVLAAPAALAADRHDLQLRRIDSSNPDAVTVAFEYDGAAADVSGLKVTEAGKKVDVKAGPLSDAKLTNGIVFVVDSSLSTDKSAVLAEARKAITSLTAGLTTAQYALVTAGKDVATVSRFGSDGTQFSKGLTGISPSGDGALWEGVVRAASQFDGLTTTIPNIVLITDGNKGESTSTTFDAAVGAVTEIGAVVQVVGIVDDDGGLSGSSDARSLADQSGGSYQESNKASDLPQLVANLKPRLGGQYVFTYKSSAQPGVVDLTLEAGGTAIRGSFVAGAVSTGAKALAYQQPASDSGFTPLQNSLGKLLAVVLALGAAALAAYALISTVVRDDGLSSALEPYAEYRVRSEADDDDVVDTGMAQTPLMQRAVALTEQLAERQGLLSKVEDALERANVPLRAAEAIFFYLVASVILALLVIAIARNAVAGLIALPVAVLLAPTVLRMIATRRKKKFESQLPDMLQLMSGTLRAGYSMMQGVEAVSQEVEEPMGRELRRVVTEARLGRPLEEALEAVAVRMDSNDFAWATMAIRIQREVGGNLAELLMTVSETMTQRERLRRDVQTLTAEGRISAYVLGILPIGLGAVMYSLNPDYMSKLTDSGLGWALLGGAAAGMIGGFFWMSRIIKIDI
jgi:tight adherence protein B